jgi:hypothetical protein
MNREQEPTVTLARDEFTETRRTLDKHPEAVQSRARIDVVDDYDNTTTWVLDLYRLEGRVTALVQRVNAKGGERFVIPPAVTAALSAHQSALVTKARRKVGKRVAADKVARGEPVGNPEALAKARKRRRGRK